MTEEPLSPPEAAKPERDEKGRLLPGNTANPTGENGLKGRARWEKIVDYYRTNCTVEELRALATDTDKLGKMPIEYAQVILHLAGTLAGKDKRGERESLYDRLWGYPTQHIAEAPQDRPTQEQEDKMTPEEAQARYERLTKNS